MLGIEAVQSIRVVVFFFFNDTATTEIYTLSLHDALPISRRGDRLAPDPVGRKPARRDVRSEEHTSELQSRRDIVCSLLLEKKKKNTNKTKNKTRKQQKKKQKKGKHKK